MRKENWALEIIMSWPQNTNTFLQITVHLQSLTLASILFSIQLFKNHKHFTRC